MEYESVSRRIRVGSRRSQLALFQTNFVVHQLRQKQPHISYDIVSMTTTGDQILNVPLSKIGEKSLFTKELEVALYNKQVEMVVHSLKDLPTTLPPGMVIGAICRRENPFDAVVFHPKYKNSSLQSLPEGSVIGTSSLRRTAQLKRCYPHLKFQSVRGNLNTRLKKLDEDDTYEALILAVAGLERMDLSNRISSVLSTDECMYAVGQGALAVECRADDLETLKLVAQLSDKDTVLCCVAERAFMRHLEGGCSVPVAVCTTMHGQELTLQGGVFSLDGTKSIVDSITCNFDDQQNGFKEQSDAEKESFCGIVAHHLPENLLCSAEQMGIDLAENLLQRGAGKILSEARIQNANS